jgi:iron complex outermembrane receptor protein
MAYASYNRGFKSGVYNISTITNVLATQPETVDAYEGGLKSQWLDRRLTLDAAVYYNKYNNLQVAVTEPGTNTQISENAAKATTSGIEVEGTLRPTDRILLRAGTSIFFEAKYDSFPNCSVFVVIPTGGLANATGDCSGKRLPSTPNTFDLQAQYTYPLPNGQSLVFNGLYSYSSLFNYAPYASPATRAPPQQPINTVNLSGTWRSSDQRLHATVWGRDLVNQQNIFRGLFYTAFGYETTYARGATYGLTLGYDF